MNKSARFLIVFIVVLAMFALTWRKDSRGMPVGDSFSAFETIAAIPSTVAETTIKTASLHNLVLVEFFAGY